MILVYAFSNQWGTNIARRTLLELQKLIPNNNEINYQIISFHPRNFFNKYVKNNHHLLIVGLGDFFGSSDRIRIETVARNVYGQESIYPLSPIKLEISMPDLDLYDPKVFAISENMGTYNCNWLAFMIQVQINQHQKEMKQMFFHLPKRASAQKMAMNIWNLLKANRMIE